MSNQIRSNISSSRSNLGPARRAFLNSFRDKVPWPVESKERKCSFAPSGPALCVKSCMASHTSAVTITSSVTSALATSALAARVLAASRSAFSSAALLSRSATAFDNSGKVNSPLPSASSSDHRAACSLSDNFKFNIAIKIRNSVSSKLPPLSVSICLKVAKARALPLPKYLQSANHASCNSIPSSSLLNATTPVATSIPANVFKACCFSTSAF
mmetsp:Transcript_28923/g.34125  ORF Transcript_28923/g.34125 Transcript_28923/m.34125 type:complete len:214 (+) Transcript_28923:741-1382(+)